MEPPKPPHPKSPEMQAYFLALGEFIDAFTHVENALIGLVLALARVSPAEAANAIFRDVRVNAAMPMVSRLLDIRGLDEMTRGTYQHLSTQIGAITKARNDIVHGGLTFGADGMPQVRRVLPTIAGVGNPPMPMPPETLHDMTSDLEAIRMGLYRLLMRILVVTGIGTGTIDPNPEPLPTWRYRPPSPGHAAQRRPEHPRRPPTRPSPSPE